MSALLLAAAAVLFALLYAFNALIRTLARSTKIGFWETFLVFLAVLLSIAALIANSLDPAPSDLLQQAMFILAGILIVPSFLLLLPEARREQGLKASRGVFGIGAGLLVLLTVLVIVPITAPIFFPPPTATATSTPQGTPPPPTSTLTATPTFTATRTPTLTPTPTSTRTPRPTDTAATRRLGAPFAYTAAPAKRPSIPASRRSPTTSICAPSRAPTPNC
ncbi:MAG: hypothetical protein U0694_11090 [Anaerolineae bacterium]